MDQTIHEYNSTGILRGHIETKCDLRFPALHTERNTRFPDRDALKVNSRGNNPTVFRRKKSPKAKYSNYTPLKLCTSNSTIVYAKLYRDDKTYICSTCIYLRREIQPKKMLKGSDCFLVQLLLRRRSIYEDLLMSLYLHESQCIDRMVCSTSKKYFSIA